MALLSFSIPDTPTVLRYGFATPIPPFLAVKARISLSIGEQLYSSKAGRKIFAIASSNGFNRYWNQIVFDNNTSIAVSAQTYRLHNLLEAVSLQIQLA